jgi:peptidoglycan/LPS O-acetylase OafA/YrhL
MQNLGQHPSAPAIVPTHVLDFMRGIAAIYVVINHVRGSFFKGGARVIAEATEPLGLYDYVSIALLRTTAMGQEFVILFFCVSGYAMAHSISHTRSVPQFYLRRAIRIWPPYLFAIALAAAVCVLFVWFDPDSRDSTRCAERLCTAEGLFLMATYVQVSSPMTAQFWSLPYEVVFYILCPFLLWRPSAIPLIFAGSVALMLVGIAVWGMRLNPSDSLLVNFAINAAFFFMSGVMAYHYIGYMPHLRPRVFCVIGLTLLALVLVIKTAYGATNAISNTVMIALTILCLRNLPHSWTSNPRWNFGFCSYSIYIYHIALIMLIVLVFDQAFGIRASDIESYWAWTLVLPFVLIGSWGMYFLGERQCNNALRRMSAARNEAAA